MLNLLTRVVGLAAAAVILSAPVPAYADQQPIMFAAIVVLPPVPPTLTQLASSTALKYGLDLDHFDEVISCESGWDPSIKSRYPGENSWGIAQINLDAHPEITLAQALDPSWSLEWMAKQWASGNADSWTCWRELYS